MPRDIVSAFSSLNAHRSGRAHQTTLAAAIDCSGVGLHTGARVTMTLRPAGADSGIRFRRTDIAGGGVEIPASWRNAIDSRLCSVLGNGAGTTISTVEHLMAALSGCGIDNAIVEVNGPELPIMDGSAAPFVFLVECVGIVRQSAVRRAIRVVEPVAVRDGDASATLAPSPVPSFVFEIDYASKLIAHQEYELTLVQGSFKAEIARARTYGLIEDIAQLRAAGLARGGSLDNAVVVDGERVMNEEGLRYDDEFVRHKLLDAVGDLYLAGAPILGRFHGRRSGHALNHRLLEALFARRSAWTWCDFPAETAAPSAPIAAPAARAVAARA